MQHSALCLLGIHFLVFANLVRSGGSAVTGVRSLQKRFSGLYTGPYFDQTISTNITAQLGTHAYLPCKIKQLGNKSVSWVRYRDSHILTVDRYTFISDERFQAFLVEATDTWTLQIKYVQARDKGVYECQVSTEPKMSHFVTLNVVVPNIEIVGESDMHVKLGSAVSIKCVITQSIEDPPYVFWFHNDQRLMDNDVIGKELKMERVNQETTVATLTIFQATLQDAGNYTCCPSSMEAASVLLHVLNGEHPAAMQRGNKNAAYPIPGRWWGPVSAGLGFTSCLSARKAVATILIFEIISHLLVFFVYM